MTSTFIRFVVPERDRESGVETGVFQVAYELRDSPTVSTTDREAISAIVKWFSEHLETPQRFNRTTSKGFYRRSPRGIAWFKASASEHLAHMHRLKGLLEANGHSVAMVKERRVGYIVYEDAYQVVAEPFSETRTG